MLVLVVIVMIYIVFIYCKRKLNLMLYFIDCDISFFGCKFVFGYYCIIIRDLGGIVWF